MTSPANSQNPTATPNSSKPSHHHPSVVESSASSAQNAPAASPALPLNGKTASTQPTPAVVRGSSAAVNGDHDAHQSSVNMAANPSNTVANGGPVGGAGGAGGANGSKSGIQFGFDSPAQAHSTPQSGAAAPIPIPGGNNARVPSPAHSPSPIPQPAASGGRPPSMQQPSGQMTFGSLGSDGEVSILF